MHKEKELLVLQYVSKKDIRLKDKIVSAYQPLVEYIARKLVYNKEDIPDLVQVGSIGLIKSLDTFDPEKEIAFSTFASSNIIGEIKHYLRDKSRIVKLPRKLQEQYAKIRQYIRNASQENGRSPTVQEIADALEITAEDVLESMEAGQTSYVLSLDKPIYSSGSSLNNNEEFSLMDSLGIEFKDDSLLNKETLKQAILSLPVRGKQIIQLRFYDGLTQKEIAERMNLSQMHISRLLNESIKSLKTSLVHKL